MFKRSTSCAWLGASVLALVAGTSISRAELPAVLERVPTESAITVVIRDMSSLKQDVDMLVKKLEVPMPEGDENPLLVAEQFLGIAGVNAKGSAAVVLTIPQPPEGAGMAEVGEPSSMVLLPVSDFAAFVKACGGTPGKGPVEITLGDKKMQTMGIDGGYALVSDSAEQVAAFKPATGQRAAHATRMGAVGRRIGDASDVVVLVNLETLSPMMKQGVEQVQQQMQGFAAMAGGNAGVESGLKVIEMVATNFVRDGQEAIVGLNVDDAAVSIDVAAQFKAKSELAGMFDFRGNAAGLVAALPKQEFLFAGAMDYSSPSMKKLIGNAMKMSEEMAAKGGAGGTPLNGGLFGGMSSVLSKHLDKIDGQAMVMGASDLGAGLFVNTSQFVATKDAAGLQAAQKQVYTEMDGKSAEGMTFRVKYTPGEREVMGIKADTYSMTMEVDPNNQAGMMMQMMGGMLFGPEMKLSGMVVPTKTGLITTMSMNSELLKSAIDAANNGKGLATDDLVKQVQSRLPADRFGEGYMGVRSIMQLAFGFMAMQGAAPEVELPERLAPVGFGATGDGGGFGMRIVVPTDVITTIMQVSKTLNPGGEEPPMMEDPAEPAKPGDEKGPKF